ncbi:MAG: tyrosine-type recombinase/integrase [Solirubrobacteraceae bacterium]
MTAPPALVIRSHNGKPYYEAKFRDGDRQVMRRIGPAWLEPGPSGAWVPRKGRVPDGHFDERRAHVRAAELLAAYLAEKPKKGRGVQRITFRELAADYMQWLATDYGAKPTTLRDHAYKLAEPGTSHRRGAGVAEGRIMAELGNRRAADITGEDVRRLLSSMTASGLSARNVNKHRNLIAAIFNHGARRATGRFKLDANPTVGIELRREPKPAPLIYFLPEEIEALARALEAGAHRKRGGGVGATDAEHWRQAGQDVQDAEAVRLSAYTGLRRGELVALRWKDVNWAGAKLTVSRALSLGVEGAPKSGSFRDVPLSDQALAAFERLSHRRDFTSPEDLVLCNAYGRHLDATALGRRYNRARDAIGLRPLRWHDLRHTFGSLLVAAGIDTVTVKAAMGHERITTTERYLHARPATQQAAAFTAAFASQNLSEPALAS